MMSELKDVMAAVNDLNQSHGVTQKGGKKYTEVAKRVEAFRTHFGLKYGITTNIVVDNEKRVVIKAQVYDLSNKEIAVGEGYAEEIRGSSLVNKTSAIENCETSAIGRALASLGLHGGQYASVNEIDKAQNNEKNIDENKEKPKAETKKPTLDETIKQTEQDRTDIANGKYSPGEEETDPDKIAEWEKIHQTYMKNISQLPAQSTCAHWFNRQRDVLISMKTAVPRMYGEIEEHYTKKLQSLTK
jgi:hypothetical protein